MWVLFTVHISTVSDLTNQIIIPESVFIDGQHQNKVYRLPQPFFSPTAHSTLEPVRRPLFRAFWENACPHCQPSFSPTLCYCHHFICTQVTVLRPCPLSEFCTDKAPKICNPLIKLMYVGDSSSLLIKLEFGHTGFIYEAIGILHRWQKKIILFPRKKLRTKNW